MSTDSVDPMSLPEAMAWAKEFNMEPSLMDFISAKASVNVVIALMSFFCPKFLEIRGCILLPWTYDSKLFEQWWVKLGGDCSEIEVTLNHLHLWDVFLDNSYEINCAYDEIAKGLTQSWTTELARQFPERKFEIRYTNDENDYGPTLVMKTCI